VDTHVPLSKVYVGEAFHRMDETHDDRPERRSGGP